MLMNFTEKQQQIQKMKAELHEKIREIEKAEIELSKEVSLGYGFVITKDDTVLVGEKKRDYYRVDSIYLSENPVDFNEVFLLGTAIDPFQFQKQWPITIDEADIIFPE